MRLHPQSMAAMAEKNLSSPQRREERRVYPQMSQITQIMSRMAEKSMSFVGGRLDALLFLAEKKRIHAPVVSSSEREGSVSSSEPQEGFISFFERIRFISSSPLRNLRNLRNLRIKSLASMALLIPDTSFRDAIQRCNPRRREERGVYPQMSQITQMGTLFLVNSRKGRRYA